MKLPTEYQSFIHLSRYARWDYDKTRRETWEETVSRYVDYITEKVSAGMVGVNIGVPVPREPFSFGGWNESRFGVGDITGKSSINFWTRLKKRTSKWNASAKKNWMS